LAAALQGSAVLQGEHAICVAVASYVQGGWIVGALLPGPRVGWRQLPLIIIGGLLIGAIFGEAIKAFAPEPIAVAARTKPRP
jgi:hypothetical protein